MTLGFIYDILFISFYALSIQSYADWKNLEELHLDQNLKSYQ